MVNGLILMYHFATLLEHSKRVICALFRKSEGVNSAYRRAVIKMFV